MLDARRKPGKCHDERRLFDPPRPSQIGGYELPAGVTVAPNIYLAHRNPEVYPEPDRFLPERFLETPPGTYTWIPFGGGVRRAITETPRHNAKVILG
jgi:Cytochrome P450